MDLIQLARPRPITRTRSIGGVYLGRAERGERALAGDDQLWPLDGSDDAQTMGELLTC